MRAFMEKVADRKIGARNTDPVVAVFEERFEGFTCRRRKNTYSGCRTTIWQMRPRSLSELSNLQTTMGICLALLQRCFTSLLLQAIINTQRTHGGTHKGTLNFVCLQGHIRTFTCQCEECCPLLQP